MEITRQAGNLNTVRSVPANNTVQANNPEQTSNAGQANNPAQTSNTGQAGNPAQANKPVQEKKALTGLENVQTKTEKDREKTPVEEVEKATQELNTYMDELKTSLGFSINEKTKDLVVNIINRDTKEIIKQIPAEELVAIREKMAELTGLLLSKKA